MASWTLEELQVNARRLRALIAEKQAELDVVEGLASDKLREMRRAERQKVAADASAAIAAMETGGGGGGGEGMAIDATGTGVGMGGGLGGGGGTAPRHVPGTTGDASPAASASAADGGSGSSGGGGGGGGGGSGGASASTAPGEAAPAAAPGSLLDSDDEAFWAEAQEADDERVAEVAWVAVMGPDFSVRGAQVPAMMAIQAKRDCIIRAATGSGKTIAAAGPLMTFEDGLVVWFSPLRELVFETMETLQTLFPDVVVLATCVRRGRGQEGKEAEEEEEEEEEAKEAKEAKERAAAAVENGAEVRTVGEVVVVEEGPNAWAIKLAVCGSKRVILLTTMDAVNPSTDAPDRQQRRAQALLEALALQRSLGRLKYLVHDEVDGVIRNASWRSTYLGLGEKVEYIRRGSLLQEIDDGASLPPPMLGITGTLSPQQAEAATIALGFNRDARVVLLPTDRTNLSYAVLNMLYFDGGYKVSAETFLPLKSPSCFEHLNTRSSEIPLSITIIRHCLLLIRGHFITPIISDTRTTLIPRSQGPAP